MRTLTLEKNQNNEAVIFRLKQNFVIRFIYGSSLFGEEIKLLTNYPKDHQNFVRNNFHELKWNNVNSNDFSSAFSDLDFKLPGTFKYKFHLKNENESKLLGCGNFLVEPKIKFSQDKELNLDLIRCQTVLTKSLGYFENWKEKLQVSYKSGYNAIHFTPIQELGGSKSSYSIKDHQKLNSMFNLENSSIIYNFDDVKNLVDFMQNQWNIISITDIVLNHTANETPWLQEHPECTYNLVNSPHLRPAYLLDRVCWHITMDINSGKWESVGLPKEINSEDHLKRLEDLFVNHYLNIVNIHEMFLIDEDDIVNEFERRFILFLDNNYQIDLEKVEDNLEIIQDVEYRRFKSKVNLNTAIKTIYNSINNFNSKNLITEAVEQFRNKIKELNLIKYSEVRNHLLSGVENVIKTVRYERLDENGPKIKFVSSKHPLVPPYFTHLKLVDDLSKEEEIIFDNSKNIFIMAHNGWVIGDNPLRNFANKESNVYLRRELIAWGDSVKLRYGDKPEDNPFLWNYMKQYIEQTVKIFHGIRLDNCHSTPMHVAEYLLDFARRVKPSLFVMAELFTSSEHFDNIFVNRLGINSLVRESFSCSQSYELGHLLHRFGSNPIGAFVENFISSDEYSKSNSTNIRPLVPGMAGAILYDQTHDNESYFIKRTPYNILTTSALVSMFCSSIGSNRGYDELVPHQIHVVNERRVYANWNEENEEEKNRKSVSTRNGIINARIILNKLHNKLNSEGYTEIYVNQLDYNTISITRLNPITMKSIILVSRTKFYQNCNESTHIKLDIIGKVNCILFEMKMSGSSDKYKADEFIINGVQDFRSEIKENIFLKKDNFESEFCTITKSKKGSTFIDLKNFDFGCVIAFEMELCKSHYDAIDNLQKFTNQFYLKESEIRKIIKNLTLEDLNYVLFKTNEEEYDSGTGRGTYNVPNFKNFFYCGLAGLMYHWKYVRINNDLGHPICENLRKGDWLPNYISSRLLLNETTKDVGLWLNDAFSYLKNIPFYVIPKYFDTIVTPLYNILLEYCWNSTSNFVINSNDFTKKLVLGTIALVGFNKSSPLPPLSNAISNLKPKNLIIDGIEFPQCATISAGLPFFSSGYMRNWGRDTFISLRGCLLLTNRFDEAKFIILAYAGVLRHGLIPNLLDRGLNSRYNCRDAVWWWLQSIKDYCQIVPNGELILKESVNRLYPTDDCNAILNKTRLQKLQETMYEALQRHYVGINFIERNAGKKIDEFMKEEGFKVKAGICKETGFPFGGNTSNCGTWMDKMGSSSKANNEGVPATSRDGSAVELVGLCYSIVSWLNKLYEKKIFPFSGVQDENNQLSWIEWEIKLKNNFEKCFWIDKSDTEKLINQREIYKDVYNSSNKWCDYQLRCNYVISMTVAPELFIKKNAQKALDTYERILVSSLGVRTLDPSDWNYNGDYNNSDDSCDFKKSHGFNYHNGPEWLWPLGYYLRARLIFFDSSKDEKNKFILHKLSKHYELIYSSEHFGLPELTNSNGSFCQDSCLIQAWSHSTLLDALYDLQCLC